MPIIARLYEFFDPGDEKPFLLGEAPRNGIQRGYDTMRNWALEGIENPITKEKVRLRVCRTPAGLATTMEEYRRFISRLNQQTGE